MPENSCYDFVIVGSGFGGSVSALRLTEKGYKVLVLERGKRFKDEDYATTNWKIWKYLWMPAARCFGILQISLFRDMFVLHGSGLGGGSLGYANVLMEPDERAFSSPAWKRPVDWKSVLAPHYRTAKHMLGVAPNPRQWKADEVLVEIARELGREHTFRVTEAGVFFGQPGEEVPDPYFDGEGPPRSGCTHCGACMVGCRHNAKNTLDKNYLYLAEKGGAELQPEQEVTDVRPLPSGQPDGARYEVVYKSSTGWLFRPEKRVRARGVVFSAGALGTLKLLFRCREITRSLPDLSPRLGDMVRTNSEALMGSTCRDKIDDYSEGIAITSIFHPDDVTAIEPVRYPAGSSLMRFLAGPLLEGGGRLLPRLGKIFLQYLLHPRDLLRTHILAGWAQCSTILLVMQTEDNRLRLKLGRSFLTLFRRGLVSLPDEEMCIPGQIPIAHQVVRGFAQKTHGIPACSVNETFFSTPMTAHILGGCPYGENAAEGVVDVRCQVHNYPGLYVVDGSIMPANPGVNPSLTITALAEYAMEALPPKKGAPVRQPVGSLAGKHEEAPEALLA